MNVWFYYAWKSFILSLKRRTEITKLGLASFANLGPSCVLLSIVVGHTVYVSALITKMLNQFGQMVECSFMN